MKQLLFSFGFLFFSCNLSFGQPTARESLLKEDSIGTLIREDLHFLEGNDLFSLESILDSLRLTKWEGYRIPLGYQYQKNGIILQYVPGESLYLYRVYQETEGPTQTLCCFISYFEIKHRAFRSAKYYDSWVVEKGPLPSLTQQYKIINNINTSMGRPWMTSKDWGYKFLPYFVEQDIFVMMFSQLYRI